MSGWGTGWSGNDWPTEKTVELIQQKIYNTWPIQILEQAKKDVEEILNAIPAKEPTSGVEINAIWQAAQANARHLNKKPTHDPYTNPNSHIYYECACGAILDPGTKSFAALNNCASEQGWKVRWGAESYQPYCVKCGEGVE